MAPSACRRSVNAQRAAASSCGTPSSAGRACCSVLPSAPITRTQALGASACAGSAGWPCGAAAVPASVAAPASSSSAAELSATSDSQLSTSCDRRCCRRRTSPRLPCSTRCRPSFLRAAVQLRPPRSTPRTMRSITPAIADASATGVICSVRSACSQRPRATAWANSAAALASVSKARSATRSIKRWARSGKALAAGAAPDSSRYARS